MKLISVPFLIFIYASIPVWSYLSQGVVVETNYGKVKGTMLRSINSRPFHSFRGIRYAKPPTGNLRFQNPEPPYNWSNILDATQEGPFCIQKNYFFSNPKVEGKEDCLYLNIYTPSVKPKHLLPVMVFIHWGGFFAGRGTSDYLGPDYFMDNDILLITFNYRLGVFGFLTTLDDAAPGNYAFKDQVQALKFVQENVIHFGGDKNRVTIFGQSAGAGSVHLHMISPLSKGLFQQAISQSGAALDLWAKPLNDVQLQITALQASFVGCDKEIGQNEKLVQCLQKVSAEQLMESADLFKYFSIEPLTPYSIVIETGSERNPSPFITKEPLAYLKEGEFQKVPWIIGSTQDEGILRVAPLLRQPETRNVLLANFTNLIPRMLVLDLSVASNMDNFFENITNFYFSEKKGNVIDPEWIQGFINLYSDRSFVYGIYQSIIQHYLNGHEQIWLYNFNYRGQYSYGDKFAATDDDIDFKWGVSHCDDLLYLFKSSALFPDLRNEVDLGVSKTLLKLWTNFARYGDPDPKKIIPWNKYTTGDPTIANENLLILNITGNHQTYFEMNIQQGYHSKRMKFWQSQELNENT